MAIRKRIGAGGQVSYGVEVYLPLTRTRQWLGVYRLKKDALLVEADAIRKLKLGEELVKREDVRYDHLAQGWLDTRQLRKGTIAAYKTQVKRTIDRWGRRSVSSIGRHDIELYVASLCDEGLSASYVRKAMQPVRQIFDNAVMRGIIKANPCTKIANLPRVEVTVESDTVRTITPADHKRLVAAAPEHWRCMVRIMPLCGLRISELLGLRWEDVDYDNGQLNVRFQLDKDTHTLSPLKTSTSRRRVNLPETAVDALKEWQKECPESELDLVFPREDGRPEFQQKVYGWFHTARKKAKLEWITPHTMRHTYVGWLLDQAGANVKYIQLQCGHTNIQTTLNIYGKMIRVDHSSYASKVDDWYTAYKS